MYAYVIEPLYVPHECTCLQKPGKGIRSPGSWSDRRKPSDVGIGEPNSYPGEEQQALITAVPSFSPCFFSIWSPTLLPFLF